MSVEIPTHWVNIAADLPGDPPPPPLSPRTGEPAGPDDLTPIFPMGLIQQEVSAEPEIAIPDAVREAYALWRPTPLRRARRFEQALGTPARIFYKYEGVSPAGSHKPNTAVAQAYENAQAGRAQARHRDRRRPVGLERSRSRARCSAWSARSSWSGRRYDQKPYRRSMMQTWGATVHRSPSDLHRVRAAPTPSHPTGSLGHRDLRGRRGRRAGATTPTTRSARCSTTCCCTRR